MFGAKKPKVDVATQKAQRRQSKAIDDQSAEEAKEIGSRSRLLNSTRKGSGLFSRSGGQGVKETLG
tara:strand:- start:14246 stop:14443 length:198 start_codon:yes stop_codon:yes gene_type:complete